jgi:hypothetical protein
MTKQSEEIQRARKRKQREEAINCLTGILLGVAVLWWFGYAFWYAPTHKAVPTHPPGWIESRVPEGATLITDSCEEAVTMRLVHAIESGIPAAEPRIVCLKGSNIEVYVTRREFETVSYPDRESFVVKVGKAGCESALSLFLPTVQMRDMKTGKVLGSYGCAFGRTVIPG